MCPGQHFDYTPNSITVRKVPCASHAYHGSNILEILTHEGGKVICAVVLLCTARLCVRLVAALRSTVVEIHAVHSVTCGLFLNIAVIEFSWPRHSCGRILRTPTPGDALLAHLSEVLDRSSTSKCHGTCGVITDHVRTVEGGFTHGTFFHGATATLAAGLVTHTLFHQTPARSRCAAQARADPVVCANLTASCIQHGFV